MTDKIAFISDIHANLEALQAVLSDIGDLETVCLGDIVGYGGSPNEVVSLVKERQIPSIMGNHDNAAVTRDFSHFNARAAMAGMWTARNLTDDSRSFLKSLPPDRRLTLLGRSIYATHGSPDDRLWEYVHPDTHSQLFGHYLRKVSADAIAVGHLHVPFVWREPEGLVFNPGSVGQPRNGDSRASYAVLSLKGERLEVEHKQVGYDIETAARRIIEAGLPEALALRLASGS